MTEIGRHVALFNVKDAATPFGFQQKRPDKPLVVIAEGVFSADYLSICRKGDYLPVGSKHFANINVFEGIKHFGSLA